MKKVYLFDLDGTLIDSTEAILDSFHHTFEKRKFNFSGDNEDIKKLIGLPLDLMFLDLGVDEDDVWEFVDTYKQNYKIISKEKTFLLDGAFEAVKKASEVAILGIVTTKTGSYSQELLEHMGIMKYFKTLVGREHVENPKPHPEPINIALKNLNINQNNEYEIWMIGDTKLDLLAAKDAGINGLGVLCGYSNKDELSIYTNYIFDNALSAVNFLENKVV